MQYIAITIYVLCSVSGLVLFKLGSTEDLTLEINRSFFCLKVGWLSVLGLILYIISFVVYMGLAAKNNLSYLVPVTVGAVYCLTMLASVVIFKEQVRFLQLLGSAFILIGLVLMNIKQK